MSGPLTDAGETTVAELAARYRVSKEAVRALLDAVIRGRGSMAQFSHPDLGGSGQWMRGGMTMVGDMFNPGLQSAVSGICSELSSQLAEGAVLVTEPSRGAVTDSAGDQRSRRGSSTGGSDWWPSELGRPSSSGGQNDDAYAYFPGTRRLAVRRGGAITIYDTGDHQISGVQQQQGSRGTQEFTSQRGTFTVDSLPVVEDAGPGSAAAAQQPQSLDVRSPDRIGSPSTPRHPSSEAAAEDVTTTPSAPPAHRPFTSPTAATSPPESGPVPAASHPVQSSGTAGRASTPADIGAAIETLAGLRDKGFLTDEEFSAKKTELLARL